jgi:uncharacterized protein YecT (DUF1311 family)/sugar lactone lactonase YvrE
MRIAAHVWCMKLKFFIGPIVAALVIASVSVSAQKSADSELSSPSTLAFDSSGNLFVTNGGGTIIKFAPAGTRSVFATGISGAWALPFDKAGNLFLLKDSHSIVKVTPDGKQSTFATGLGNPQGLAVDSAGNLFVADMGTGSILKFTPSGTKSTFARGIALPRHLAFDGSDNLFVSDLSNAPMIVKFIPAGAKSTFAPGVTASALTFDKAGNLFVADTKSQSILKFAPDGTRSTFASGIEGVEGMAFDAAGNLLVSDATTSSIFKFAPGGEKSAFIAGPPAQEPVKFSLPVINIDDGKAELVAGTGTSDGRLALAWTVRPLKDAKPVDWSMLEKDREKFKEAYGEENYFVDILLLDVPKNKNLGRLKLAQSWYLPGFAHSSLQVLWGPEENGRRFAIVNCDRKWSPQDLILLDVDRDAISQRSVLAPCDEAVRKFALEQDRARHRRPAKDYVGEYPVFGLPELGRREGFSDANTLWLPFSALSYSDPKSGYAGSGTLRLKLEHGSGGPIAKIENISVEATDKSEKSVSSDARFLDADQRLNQIYNALRDRLPPVERNRLKQEQRAWINQRNTVGQLTNGKAQENSLENPTAVADRELVKMTEARTAELEQWLNKVK